MGKTLIVFVGKYGSGTASAKRVRQLAAGLRASGDEACVICYDRGSQAAQQHTLWSTDEWGVPHAAVYVGE